MIAAPAGKRTVVMRHQELLAALDRVIGQWREEAAALQAQGAVTDAQLCDAHARRLLRLAQLWE